MKKKEVDELLKEYGLLDLEEKKPNFKLLAKKKKEDEENYSRDDIDPYDEAEIKQKLCKKIYKILKNKDKKQKTLKKIAVHIT